MDGIFWFSFWLTAALFGLVTAKIASDRSVPPESNALWFLAGAFLFIIALPLAIFMRPDPKIVERKALRSGDSKKCPKCAELVKKEAHACRFCGFEFKTAVKAMTAADLAKTSPPK